MIQTFLLVLPFALAGAVSPMMLTEQTLLLASPAGRRGGRRYAIAAAAVLFAFVALLVVFGRAISLPREPSLDANLDLVLGAALLLASLLIRRASRREGKGKAKKKKRTFGPNESLGFGAFSMATNFTTLALVIPAAKIIAAGDQGFLERLVLMIVLVAIASTPAWLPLALTSIAPGPAERGLSALGRTIQTHGRVLTVGLLGALGCFLILRGLVEKL